MTKILIADALNPEGAKILEAGGEFQVDNRSTITPEELLNDIGQYSAVVIRSRTKITKEVLEKAEQLKVVGRAGAGLDNVDQKTATERGIVVMNTPGGNTVSAAEHAFTMMMAAARRVAEADASMKQGRWDKKKLVGHELNNKTIGIVGLGRIGIEVAKRVAGFNMRILGFDPFISQSVAASYEVELVDLEQIYKESDFITIHTPKTEETLGMFNSETFAKMKNSCVIVNCARGGIIVEDDLVKALEEGQIAAAALDVFAKEPLPEDSPLRKMSNIVLTPHLAASTEEAQENVALQIAEQIVDLLKTGQIRNAANAPALAPEVIKKIRPYLDLGENLGKFISQLIDWPVSSVTIRYYGSCLDFPISAITTAVAKGFVENKFDPPVNFINAMHIIKSLGIELVDMRDQKESDYTNLITIETQSESGEKCLVSGTLFTETTPRIVQILDKRVDAEPTGVMIVLENDDVPGVVGRVATHLGSKGINIGQMTWGRIEKRKEALTIINLDGDTDNALADELAQLDNIRWAKIVRL